MSYHVSLSRLSIMLLLCTVIGCSSSDSTSTVSSSDMSLVQSVKTVDAKMEKASDMYGSKISTASWFHPESFWTRPVFAASITAEWDDKEVVSIMDPVLQGSNRVTLKDYMGKQFEADAVRSNGSAINVFGRINDTMKVFCGLSLGITDLDSDGYPIDGSYDIEITDSFISSIKTECDITVTTDDLGSTVNVVISVPTDTSLFDKKASMTINDNPYILYVRYNSSEVNVASTEKSDKGEYRTTVLYNKTTQVMRAEYISAKGTGVDKPMYIYRIFSDELNNIGFILAREGGSNTDYKFYTVSGTPDGSGNTALSFSLSDAANHAGGAKTDLNACVSNTGDIVTDNTLDCGGSIDLSSRASSTVLAAIINTVVGKNDKTGWNTMNEATGHIQFTSASEMFSEDFITP